jgi:hypothetical protein
MAATALLLERIAPRPRPEPEATWVDWESAAGGDGARPRVGPLGYRYSGSADSHLLGQPCQVIESVLSDPDACVVAFACGCRVSVVRHVLQPA